MKCVPGKIRHYYEKKYARGTEVPRTYKNLALQLLPEEPSHVLDVGCATGEVSGMISDLGHEVVGLDISLNALNEVDLEKANRTQADLNETLPFQGESFDVVWCGDVLEHVFNPDQFLGELQRVTRSDGRIVLIVPNSSHFLYRLLYLGGSVPSEIQVNSHLHYYSFHSIKKLLETNGLSVERVHGRNLYIALKEDWIPDRLREEFLSILNFIGFHSEYSYSDEQNIWIWTAPSSSPNRLLSDHFIFEVRK